MSEVQTANLVSANVERSERREFAQDALLISVVMPLVMLYEHFVLVDPLSHI